MSKKSSGRTTVNRRSGRTAANDADANGTPPLSHWIPSPKGMRPAITSEDHELEAAAFSGQSVSPRLRRVSDAALEAAKRRMQPPKPEPEPEPELAYDERYADEPLAPMAPLPTPPVPATPGGFRMPTASPAAPASTLRQGLNLTAVMIEDVDLLWDWIRQDPDRGAAFFLSPPSNSVALHRMMERLVISESQGTAVGFVRVITYFDGQREHAIGFVILSPILVAESVAVLHVYLRQDVRSQLAAITGELIEDVAALAPGYRLAVYSKDDVWARIHQQVLGPLGFTRHTMFVR